MFHLCFVGSIKKFSIDKNARPHGTDVSDVSEMRSFDRQILQIFEDYPSIVCYRTRT